MISRGKACIEHDKSNYRVIHYQHRHLKHGGVISTDHSTIECMADDCHMVWQTKSAYVDELEIAEVCT